MSQLKFQDDTTFEVETVSSKSTCTSGYSITSANDFVDVKANHCRAIYKDSAGRDLICMGKENCQKKGHKKLRATQSLAPTGKYYGIFSKRAHKLLGARPGTKTSTAEYNDYRGAQRESNRDAFQAISGLVGNGSGSKMSTPEQISANEMGPTPKQSGGRSNQGVRSS